MMSANKAGFTFTISLADLPLLIGALEAMQNVAKEPVKPGEPLVTKLECFAQLADDGRISDITGIFS